MRMNELSQAGQVLPSDLVLLWASSNGGTRTAPVSLLTEAVKQAVFDIINLPGGLVGIGAAASGFNNDITGLGGITTSRDTSDLNTCPATGWYVTLSSAANQPSAAAHLVWHQQGSVAQRAQLAINLTTGAFLTRKAYVPVGGTALVWSAWKGQVQAGDITAANLPLSTAVGQAVMQAANAGAARVALGMTTLGQNLVIAADQASAMTTLGGTVTGQSLFTAATAAAARLVLMTTFGASLVTQGDAVGALGVLGVTSLGRSLITQSQAADMRSTLGATQIGNNLFIAADTAAARLAIGATTTGNALITAADAAAAQTAIGATTTGKSLIVAADAAAARTAITAAVDAAPTATVRGTVLQAAATTDIAAAPTQADFNALLAKLRTSGIMATA